MKSGYNRRRLMSLGAYQDDRCFFCDERLEYLDPRKHYSGRDPHSNGPRNASFDHYIAKRNGGGGTRENTVIAHRQCNSHKGHEPTPEFDEKLRLLNIKRGFGDENGNVAEHLVMRRLRPDEFCAPFEALNYLCDLANEVEGSEGIHVRRAITRRIQNHKGLLQGLAPIQSPTLRREAALALMQYRDASSPPNALPDPLETLLRNVLKTMVLAACGERSRRENPRKQAQREAIRKTLAEDTGERPDETQSSP